MKTIPHLLDAVPIGEERVFLPTRPVNVSDVGFSEVWENGDYCNLPPIGDLTVRDGGEVLPIPGVYGIPHTPISELSDRVIKFRGSARDLVDLYIPSIMLYLLSDRLHQFLLDHDPNGMESKPVQIQTSERTTARYWAVISKRILDAIDPETTTVQIQHKRVGDSSLRHVRFSGGGQFRADVVAGVPTFIDFYRGVWTWSDQIFEDAKAAGFRNIRGRAPLNAVAAEKFRF